MNLAEKLTAAEPKPKMQPTEEQAAIIAAAVEGHPVLVVEAGAGTGKTSTLRLIGDAMRGNGQYTAFNSSLVAESKEKFSGTRVACNTTHSLAFRAVGKRYSHRLGGARVRAHQIAKQLGIEDLTIKVDGKDRHIPAGFLASQVTGAIKRFCQSADPEPSVSHFRYIDGIDLPVDGERQYANNQRVREYLLPFAVAAWKDLSSPDGSLPFSHDHYVKVWQLNNPVIAADYIMLDEAQDTAPVMLDVLRQQSCPIVLVGDSAQQIYEWRGAVNAMTSFPGAPRRLLSQSFRFGQAIADVANAILSCLAEPTELRLKGRPGMNSKVEPVAEPVAILTRTNAVAIASLLEAIAAGKRPFLVGGGSDVIAFVEAAQSLQQGQSTSHPDLACFGGWGEVQEYVKQDEGEDLRLMVKIIDSFGCDVILGALRNMPEEADADLVISTAHKSKGRQWKTVQLAADFPTKSKCDDADLKLLYVAATRAMEVLDVSGCPFFTGRDSLDINSIRDRVTDKSNANPITPAAPSTPPAPTQFTWRKFDGAWCANGPSGHVGETVDVVRKDGSKQSKRLLAIINDFGANTVYRV